MQAETGVNGSGRRPLLGILSFVSGVLASGSVAMIAWTSLAPGFDPPGWLRIATMAPLPVLLLASLALGAAGLARRSGRAWAVVGISVSALAVAGFVALIARSRY